MKNYVFVSEITFNFELELYTIFLLSEWITDTCSCLLSNEQFLSFIMVKFLSDDDVHFAWDDETNTYSLDFNSASSLK
jgi:hypothetical protein